MLSSDFVILAKHSLLFSCIHSFFKSYTNQIQKTVFSKTFTDMKFFQNSSMINLDMIWEDLQILFLEN